MGLVIKDILKIRWQRPLFYGWWIVAIAFLVNFISIGIGVYAFGVFIPAMSEDPDLNWSKTAIAGAFTVNLFVAALLAPLIGPLLDKKHGPRVVLALGALLAGAGLMALSRADALWQFYLFFGLLGSLGFIITVTLTTPAVVSKWFIRKRGRALGITFMGSSAGAMVMVPISQVLVSTYGWRTAWFVLGLITVIAIVPLVSLFMRRRPEDMGLKPDGEYASAKDGPISRHREVKPLEESTWTLKSAIRTPSLWLLLLAFNMAFMAYTGIVIFQIDYLTNPAQGFSKITASSAVSLFAAVSIMSKLSWGLIAERLNPRYAGPAGFLISAGAIIVLLNVNNLAMVYLYAILLGIGVGNVDLILNIMLANYYGRTFLGAITGFSSTALMITTGAAPLLVASLFDATGSYTIPFLLSIGALVFSGLLILLAKPPREQTTRPERAAEW